MKFSTITTVGSASPCNKAIWLLLALLSAPALSDALYKYQDENGNWVFADKRPEDGRTFEREQRQAAVDGNPNVSVDKVRGDGFFELVATNSCHCPAEVAVILIGADNAWAPSGSPAKVVVPALGSAPVMQVKPRTDDSNWSFDFEVAYVFGDPSAAPDSNWVYRPPFAPAKEFRVSQAFPDQITHVTPDSRHAVDIAMPEQSGVYAARAGMVIAVTHKNFRGGADWGKYGANANVVKILHDDGTIALYAHLSWDSIRVRPGQRIVAGEFIAMSGNTGFSTGPHLHFAVVRNSGFRIDSVPLRFSNGQNEVVRPRSGGVLQNP